MFQLFIRHKHHSDTSPWSLHGTYPKAELLDVEMRKMLEQEYDVFVRDLHGEDHPHVEETPCSD